MSRRATHPDFGHVVLSQVYLVGKTSEEGHSHKQQKISITHPTDGQLRKLQPGRKGAMNLLTGLKLAKQHQTYFKGILETEFRLMEVVAT